jgi:hypothetical protein
MRTTVDIPDELLIRAKKRAVELRKPLRALIEEGLRTCLAGQARPGDGNGRIDWVVAQGGTPVGLDLSNREAMHDWMRKRP